MDENVEHPRPRDWLDVVSMLCSEFGYTPDQVAELDDITTPLQIANRRFWQKAFGKLNSGQNLTEQEAEAIKPYMQNKRI